MYIVQCQPSVVAAAESSQRSACNCNHGLLSLRKISAIESRSHHPQPITTATVSVCQTRALCIHLTNQIPDVCLSFMRAGCSSALVVEFWIPEQVKHRRRQKLLSLTDGLCHETKTVINCLHPIPTNWPSSSVLSQDCRNTIQ